MKSLFGKLAFVVLGSVMLSGCASIIKSNDDTLSLTSQPPGAKVEVKDQNGEPIHSGVTPTTVTLRTDSGYFQGAKYSAEFSKEGYYTTTRAIGATVRGWYWGNLGFGGLIGFLIVDPMTGAMWKLNADRVNVGLQQK